MKIIAEIDCEKRHCNNCSAIRLSLRGNIMCTVYNKALRETGRGVLRCQKCMDSEQAYKKLESLKTCDNCKNGPLRKCMRIKQCSNGWGSENLWESEE